MSKMIVQLSKNPINTDDYIREADFFTNDGEPNFVGTITSYVDENIDRSKFLDIFVLIMKQHGAIYDNQKESLVINQNTRDSFFKERYNNFKELSETLSFEEFSTLSYNYHMMRKSLEDKYSIYIETEYGYVTLETFLRGIKEEYEFFVGGILKYS